MMMHIVSQTSIHSVFETLICKVEWLFAHWISIAGITSQPIMFPNTNLFFDWPRKIANNAEALFLNTKISLFLVVYVLSNECDTGWNTKWTTGCSSYAFVFLTDIFLSHMLILFMCGWL